MTQIKCLVLLFIPFLLPAQQNKQELISQYMEAQEKVNGFSGVVLVAKGNKVVYEKSFGLADREGNIPNTPTTKFRIYSVSKQFTAVCILKLAEENKLSLQDNLAKFFPDFPNGDHITIQMLLTHTSGLRRDFLKPSDGPYKYIDFIGQAISKEEILSIVKKTPPESSPGKKESYSNLGFLMLGYIVEKASGMSYAEFISQNIFVPLHMTNSGVCSKKETCPGMAVGYNRVADNRLLPGLMNMDFLTGCGNIYSTAEDLYKWENSFYGSVILSESLRNQKLAPYVNRVGYGPQLDTLFRHACTSVRGSAFGYEAAVASFHEDSTAIIVLSNNESASGRINYSLAGILWDVPVTLPYPHQTISMDKTLLNKYAGRFGNTKINKKKGHLYLNNVEESMLLPESTNKFYLADKSDWTIEFVLDTKGNVVAMISSIGGISETISKTTRE